jgi:hypothetical protein
MYYDVIRRISFEMFSFPILRKSYDALDCLMLSSPMYSDAFWGHVMSFNVMLCYLVMLMSFDVMWALDSHTMSYVVIYGVSDI